MRHTTSTSTVCFAALLLSMMGCATTSAPRPTMEAPPMVEPSPPAAPAKAAASQGYEDYRFGMTLDEVRGVTACRPYQIIASTDLECPNLEVDGQRRNVSFHFDAGGRLETIQLWFAERVGLDDGVQAVLDMNAHFDRRFGTRPPPNARELVTNILQPMQSQRYGFVAKPEGELPPDAVVWGQVTSMPGLGFFVMVYYRDPAAPPVPGVNR